MRSMSRLMRHPSELIDEASDDVSYYARKMAKSPARTGTIILAILGIAGFIWLFPELHRYIRMERM